MTSGMVEDRTRVVEIVEFEAETIDKLLEFIYSGEIEDMGDQLDSVFEAADYYGVMGLVCIWYCDNILVMDFTQFRICINLFGETDVTPSNALKILKIADRHRVDKLKKVETHFENHKKIFLQRVFAWIKAERQIYIEDAIFTREMRRCPELMAELGVETEWGLDDI